MDPTEEYEDDNRQSSKHQQRQRQGSVTSVSSASETAAGGGITGQKEKQIRMPPSLTLSKIRSLKNQALLAAVKAGLEVGTVALACVYFERLCLDCRVDKSNRRLSFAACLLLASKLNEPSVELVMRTEEGTAENNMTTRLQALVRPNKRSGTMFAALLEFFTQEWNLSLKHLFDAEWGVFAALGFSLLATPSQVAFHFKRMMKQLEWNPLTYLGEEMYEQWQLCLADEEHRRQEKERRREKVRQRKQEQLLSMHLELKTDIMRRQNANIGRDDNLQETPRATPSSRHAPGDGESSNKLKAKGAGIKLLSRFGMRRVVSQERIPSIAQSEHISTSHIVRKSVSQHRRWPNEGAAILSSSPSMPAIVSAYSSDAVIAATEIPVGSKSDASSIESVDGSTKQDEAIFV